MKARIAIAAAVAAVFVCGLVAWQHRARAADLAPPTKMDFASVVRLDRDLGHIREAEAAIARVQAEVRPYAEDAMAILTAAKISPDQFGKSVRVDFQTGVITRDVAAPPISSTKSKP